MNESQTEHASRESPTPIEVLAEVIDSPKAHHDRAVFALLEAMGWQQEDVTRAQWGEVHAAAKQLTEIGADSSEAPLRARNYQINHPDWALTPSALVKWWADSAAPRQRPTSRQVEKARQAADRRAWRNG